MIKSFLEELTGKAVGSSKTNGSSFIIYFVMAAIAAIGFSIISWLLMRAKRKAAKLAYEVRKKEEELALRKDNAELAKNKEDREIAEKDSKEIEKEISILQKRIEEQVKNRDKQLAAIDALTKWSDITRE